MDGVRHDGVILADEERLLGIAVFDVRVDAAVGYRRHFGLLGTEMLLRTADCVPSAPMSSDPVADEPSTKWAVTVLAISSYVISLICLPYYPFMLVHPSFPLSTQ